MQSLSKCSASTPLHTAPNVSILVYINNDFRKTVITTLIAAGAQCRNEVTNRIYHCDLLKFTTILKFGTVPSNTVVCMSAHSSVHEFQLEVFPVSSWCLVCVAPSESTHTLSKPGVNHNSI